MANWFNRVQKVPRVQHSVNDNSYDYKTSCKMGQLVPVFLSEVLPSDKFINLSNDVYLRLAPMIYPLMHRVKVKTHNFFTPLRIILGEDLYQEFLNGKADLVPIKFVVEEVATDDNPFVNTIIDYLGVDINRCITTHSEVTEKYTHYIVVDNPTPILAYLCIVRDWFLDSVLNVDSIDAIDSIIEDYRSNVQIGTTMGHEYYPNDPDDLINTFTVAYGKDYFTTARPTPQMGSDMFVLNRPLMLTSEGLESTGSEVSLSAFNSGEDGDKLRVLGYDNDANSYEMNESTTIRDLWRKEAIQAWEQHSNSFGNRIREQLAAHFGVIISDKRLMIPQYCGGSHSYVQISEVINTNDSMDSAALGAFAGKASSYTSSHENNYFCEEHGIMMTLLSIIPDNGYCNGQNRLFFKKNILDFAVPEFNNIGWQEIYNGEIFADGSDADKGTFGYQPRYSEYRTGISRVTGQFRQSSLLPWHLNRNFDSLPPLNADFLKVADTDRIFNFDGTTGDCPIFVDCFNKCIMSRPLSKEPDEMHLY